MQWLKRLKFYITRYLVNLAQFITIYYSILKTILIYHYYVNYGETNEPWIKTFTTLMASPVFKSLHMNMIDTLQVVFLFC
jgi:hypothetical protein